MATVLSFDETEQSEMFCLIWLDSSPHEDRNTEQQLRAIINQMKKFQDLQQCQQFIEKSSGKDRLILIVSGRLGREILPRIHHIRQVISIYIYCMDKPANELWSSKYAKVKSAITNVDDLIAVITKDQQIEKKIEEPLSINIFSVGGKSTSELNGKFVFSQVLIDCLLRLKSTDRDQQELIQLLKQQYLQNRFELDFINDFSRNYQQNQALDWYTKECFFYKTLNCILRNENVHWIFLYRSFISDLQQQLQKYQSKTTLQVYRAQIISKEELENLTKSINQFISINSFFSTTAKYQKALAFLNRSRPVENTERILFTIRADPKIAKIKPFADISRFSAYPGEAEVLFMIGSIFQLKNISFDQKNQCSVIEMSLSSDDDHQLKQVLLNLKQQTGEGPTDLRILAKILSKTSQFELAEKYLKRMLEQISPNDPQLGDLYEDIGEATSQRGKLDESIEWRQKSIEFKQNNAKTSPSPAAVQLKG